MRVRRFASLCLFFSLALLAPAFGGETVVLKSGDQFRSEVTGITSDGITCIVDGEEKVFPLADLQRIDFEREREFDGLDTPEALSAASDVFARALALDNLEMKERFPQAGYVIISDDTVVNVAADGTYRIDRTIAWRVLEQRGADSAHRSHYYLPGSQTPEVLFGITVGPNGEVARISDSAMKDEAVYPAQPEYNYEHRLRYNMKNAVPGATLFLKTRLAGTATKRLPMVVGRGFWHNEPAISQSVKLVAEGKALENVSIGVSGGLESAPEGLVWTVEDSPQVFWESLMPPYSSFAPRLLIASPKAAWGELAAEFVKGIKPGAALDGDADADPRDIYDRVRKDIRTIGVSQDALPEPPADPSLVLERGYGTIVEKALLLEALLTRAGHRASTVLVRARGRGPLLVEVARFKGLLKALVRLEQDDGSVVWLQVDNKDRGFGELGGSVQATVGLDLSSGRIVEIPACPAEAESSRRTTHVELAEDGSALVKHRYELKGLSAAGIRSVADMSEKEQLKWAASRYGAGQPGADLESFTHSDFTKANETEVLEASYTAPALARKAGDFLILRMPDSRYSPVEVGRSTRQWDLFWRTRTEAQVTITVRPPEGYAPYATSEGAHIVHDGWLLNASFSEEAGGDLVYHELWRREALDAPREAYQALRETLVKRGLLRDTIIVFHKTVE